jgi:hypothetical protein
MSVETIRAEYQALLAQLADLEAQSAAMTAPFEQNGMVSLDVVADAVGKPFIDLERAIDAKNDEIAAFRSDTFSELLEAATPVPAGATPPGKGVTASAQNLSSSVGSEAMTWEPR